MSTDLNTPEAHRTLDDLIAMLERIQIVLRSMDRKLDLLAGAPETHTEYLARRDREAIANERDLIETYHRAHARVRRLTTDGAIRFTVAVAALLVILALVLR